MASVVVLDVVGGGVGFDDVVERGAVVECGDDPVMFLLNSNNHRRR
jgi:hypothetical protein